MGQLIGHVLSSRGTRVREQGKQIAVVALAVSSIGAEQGVIGCILDLSKGCVWGEWDGGQQIGGIFFALSQQTVGVCQFFACAGKECCDCGIDQGEGGGEKSFQPSELSCQQRAKTAAYGVCAGFCGGRGGGGG